MTISLPTPPATGSSGRAGAVASVSPLQPSPPDGSPVSGLSASPVRRRGSHGLSDWRVGWRKIEVLAEADAGEGRHDMLGGWRGETLTLTLTLALPLPLTLTRARARARARTRTRRRRLRR